MELRDARLADHEAVAAFTKETWPERDGGDYIPDIYPEWIEGEDRRTLVVDAGDEIAGIVQCVLLSEDEAWCQGMRVNPDFRGADVSKRLSYGTFDWAREQGALVARNMVFSWNTAGLGQSRSVGFEPTTEFRWAHPEPDSGAESELDILTDPAAAWRAWTESETRTRLRGLALDLDESWALSELARADLERAAEEKRVFAVRENGLRGTAYRSREYTREREGESERWAEYGVGSWADLDAARALFAAISRDAADIGADRTRVLIPETARTVSDAAYVRAGISDEPDFVLSADLTAERTINRH
jgi:GNAT superfamily N-acetyltransferase